MTKRKCSFINCDSCDGNFKGKFFNYRAHDLAAWVNRSGNIKLTSLSKGTLTHHYHVCSKHFDRHHYTRPITPFKNRLKADALPNPAVAPCPDDLACRPCTSAPSGQCKLGTYNN